jgi:uncharacterized protein (TIGR03067 family)
VWLFNVPILDLEVTMNARLMMTVGIGLLLAADIPQEPAAKKDLENLQSSWKLVSAMQDGKALSEDTVKRTTIVFQGNKFTFPGQSEQATSKEGTIQIDPTKEPKRMDARSTQGDVMPGIYELKGDHYKVCFAPLGKKRPSTFVSTPENGYIIQVWVRQKTR